jgi:hypothetical protein
MRELQKDGPGLPRSTSSGHLRAHVLSHQAGLFMFQDVAVKHKGVRASSRPIEGHERLGFVLDPQSP